MTPGPIAVPELDHTVDGVVEPATPGWWTVFEGPRFPQPGTTRTPFEAPQSSPRPRFVPEAPVEPLVAWPSPVLADAAAHVRDSRPSAAGTTPTGGRAIYVAAVVIVVLSVGVLAAALHRPASAPHAPTSAPAAGGATSHPSASPSASTPTTHAASSATTGPGSVSPATGTTPPTTPAPRPTGAPGAAVVAAPPPQVGSGPVFDYERATTPTTVGDLATDPGSYADRTVAFSGVIKTFVLDSSGGALAMYVSEPTDPSTVVLIQLSEYDDVTRIDTGDTVVIWGNATGRVDYANTLGQPPEVTNVDEAYLTDSTSGYQDMGDTGTS